jgi:hypothetical protein
MMKLKAARALPFPLGFLLLAQACSAIQPPSVNGPRTNEPLYPVLLTEDAQRRDSALTFFKQLTQRTNPTARSNVPLRSVTATIENLPRDTGSPLYLPKVGAGSVMNEDEIRESLRRFLNDWRGLIGANPAQLSLLNRIDQPDGTKLANYEQRAFRYPLRGNYGKLQISFTADRRILNVSSSCIPEADRLQTALGGVTTEITREEAVKRLQTGGLSFVDSSGKEQKYQPGPSNTLNVQELVVYALPSKANTDALEFHLAWEIAITQGPLKTAYLDAVKGQIVAAE